MLTKFNHQLECSMSEQSMPVEETMAGNPVERFLRGRWLRIPRALWVLAGVLLLAALLRLVNLDAVGDGNLYYAAAVKSMLTWWHNFFFAAAEPGGSVTVDKPPLGLWIQTLSAALLGVNTYGLILPQILAGLGSVVLIYLLVRRWFGEAPGLLAAFILAATPVSVAVERNNTMDALLIFTLLLAAWAFIQAADRHPVWLLPGGLLIGLGFNIKMLQAFLPVPFFFLYFLLASRQRLLRKMLYLLLSGLLVLVVSLSWAVIVDSIPEENRPYVGSSENNTVMELILGHNGLNRLFGNRTADSLLAELTGDDGASAKTTDPASAPLPGGELPAGSPQRPPLPNAAGERQPYQQLPGQGSLPGGNQLPADGPGVRSPDGQTGSTEIGEPGIDRLFTLPLANEISWLLPAALVLLLVLMAGSPLRLPLSVEWRAVVLWGGWLITCVVFFSYASFFHAYYLAMLAPPLAAVAAAGVSRLWNMVQRASSPAALLAILLFSGTLVYQAVTAVHYTGSRTWIWLAWGLLAAGVILLLAGMARHGRIAGIGYLLLLAAVLAAPVTWSVRTTLEPYPHTGLPGAYGGETQERQPGRDQYSAPLQLEFLMEYTADMTYLLAVPGSMQGAEYVLATGRPVLYIGGFNGGDPVLSLEEFQSKITGGELRFVLLSGDAGRNENAAIFRWVGTSCTRLPFRQEGPAQVRPGEQGAQPQVLFDCAAPAGGS